MVQLAINDKISENEIPPFTPGPWLTVKDNGIVLMFGIPNDDPLSVDTYRVVWSDSSDGERGGMSDVAYIVPTRHDNGNGNARVIAAAPWMFGALELLNRRMQDPDIARALAHVRAGQ